ncbi:MAG TPA: chorismate mutase [Saprospiraceae bacterium]|nr:chorismate mutase [Saprospiraceae bacterium]HNT18808.1 chorismate mutase [Saprospiraceae bacterium]
METASLSTRAFMEKGFTKPYLIAGPCSAETEEQVMATAAQIAAEGIKPDLFRAGIWKPRTRPGSFEGIGRPGLNWLKKVKEEYGWKTTTEVANTQHVFDALKAGVDVLWIGARTTVNPFSVQEIADALVGVDIPVLVKNPINPDLSLWIGSLERLKKAGITRLGVIHRGFSAFGKSIYRNTPRWELPIELIRQYPDLFIICDASHICGNRPGLWEVAQRAMDLNYDGIMIETHCNPDAAWSDAAQQVTGSGLKNILDRLVVRQEKSADPKFIDNIEDIRHQIDVIDNELLNILGERMKLADKIGMFKKMNNISILQSSRWNEIIQKSQEKGKALGLSEDFITKVLTAIHEESIEHQEKIMIES